jgi:ribosomal protein S27E
MTNVSPAAHKTNTIMSEERKTYTYRCVDCDERYEFSHAQTYKNCNKCKWRGNIVLESIEKKEVEDE